MLSVRIFTADFPQGGQEEQQQQQQVPDEPQQQSATIEPQPQEAGTSDDQIARSVFISGLVRPFTEDAFRSFLTDNDAVELVDLWMDNPVKSVAIATFSSPDVAESVRVRANGVVWPKLGKALVAEACTEEHMRLKHSSTNVPQEQSSAASMDVDDLFEKTSTKPNLYYTYNKAT